jgi:dihydrofolate reductase
VGRLIVSEFISIDGFYADLDGGLDWVVADDEHHDYSIALLERTGLLLFGRRTYEAFESYWPGIGEDPDAPGLEVAVGAALDRLPKMLYSHTRGSAGWGTTVRQEMVPAELAAVKEETSGEVVVFGSGRLVNALVRAGLVDAYHLLVQPVALGAGLSLFEPGRRADLAFDRCEPLHSGVVRMFYTPASGPVERVNYAS